MGVSYQTKNRLRRKVMTAPLAAPPELLQPPAPAPARSSAGVWWPVVAAVAVAVAAFFALYRG